PARGRKPVLRDELAAVVVKQQYPPERLRKILEIAMLLLRFFLRARSRSHPADATGLGEFISARCLSSRCFSRAKRFTPTDFLQR
ncbi:MAG: hypothetical protein JXA30_10265, partial [Deltaproteobacteria bacterium]|nr:hypothetical protein [Deltaproteobacteria bacterium]